jgi:hypothetical protein
MLAHIYLGYIFMIAVDPDGSVGMATRCQLDWSGDRIPVGGEIFSTRLDRPLGPPNLLYRGADKSLGQPTSRCILFDGENISFDNSLVTYIYIYIYIYSTNIPPIMIINMICEHQNLLSL